MNWQVLGEIWQRHSGKIIGMASGFIISVSVLVAGFLQTIFIVICVAGGYFIGGKIDSKQAKEGLLKIVEKVLPPDYR